MAARSEEALARQREYQRRWRRENRDHINEQRRARRQADPYAAWSERLWDRFRLTPKDWYVMLQEQAGRCGICEIPMTHPCVDHCHTSGAVRGLLCKICNSRLGWFERNRAAITTHLESK